MFYKFTIKPIVIKAPTESDAWDKFIDEHYIDPEDIEIEVECLGEE